MEILFKAINAIKRKISPQPSIDDYIQVANLFRNQMGIHLINPQTRKVPETGEPITIESFGPSLDAWEKTLPGAKAQFFKMVENETRRRLLAEKRAARQTKIE